tara:strand:- start:2342 stop:2656 length:315 start_codon:yes stop_codon:yes gene_type:complete
LNLTPKDYTAQEKIIAEELDELGFRYAEQYIFFPYTVDFYVPELKLVIEADGKYGHLKKRDAKRDMKLAYNNEIEYILHISALTKSGVKETLWRGLNKLEKNSG